MNKINFECFISTSFLGNTHTIYDGIMLPPDEGNTKIWNKITNKFFPKFIKKLFSSDMNKIYFNDAVSAMFHEIPMMNSNDKRIRNFKCAKDYMVSIINSINRTFRNNEYDCKEVIEVIQS